MISVHSLEMGRFSKEKKTLKDKVLGLIVLIDAFRFIFIKYELSESIRVLVQGKKSEVSTLVAPLNFAHQFPIHR